MKLLLITLMLTTTAFANELSPRISEVLGLYDSTAARQSETYMAHDLSSFKVMIDPEMKASVYFEEWDITLALDSNLNFEDETGNECDDVGCSGVDYIEGQIKFKQVEGKEVPYAVVTLNFYYDRSEDIDCDEIDCDDLDYSNYFDQWTETYEFEFQGSFEGQLPAFKPTTANSEILVNIEECKNLIRATFVKCANTQSFKFEEEVSERGIRELSDFLSVEYKTQMTKELALEVISLNIENILLQTKVFTFNGEETQAYLQVKANLEALLELTKNIDADRVIANHSGSTYWSNYSNIDFIFINSTTLEATRIKFNF